MKIVIVNCFETNEPRVNLIYEYFKKLGNDVTVIQSDFMHIKKTKRVDEKKDFIFVETNPYYKNLSIDRIKSHYNFSKHAFEIVGNIKPNLIYAIVPPNFLVKFASDYKKHHKDTKLYFDIMDLWPETMPIKKIKKFPPFIFWQNLRDKNLRKADYIVTECNLYQEVLEKELKENKTSTIYLAKRDSKITIDYKINDKEINLCYLGSINNIIDIEKIKEIIFIVNKMKQTTLHIIGDGENKEKLISEVKSTGAKVNYYGKIYDHNKKKEIFDRCNFGLNIMKNTVCVGLTMKSIDYFQYGLPIINNIKSDTFKLVNKYNIGINISDNNINDVAEFIVGTGPDEMIKMRENTHKLFDDEFSFEAFNKKLEKIFKGVL